MVKTCLRFETGVGKGVSVAERILCLNVGSSSLKLALYELGAGEERLCVRGTVDRLGSSEAKLRLENLVRGEFTDESLGDATLVHALGRALDAMASQGYGAPSAVGHRVVHGGPDYDRPQLLTEEVLKNLRSFASLAPLHTTAEIEAIGAIRRRDQQVPQVACFDTSFFAAMPRIAKLLPLPQELFDEGVRRFGFHGISYEYVLEVLGEDRKGRVVIAHLGAGSSLAAVKDGTPVDTTMGLTPAGGLMMGSRSGDLDPGIAIYLARAKGYSPDRLERLFNSKSGLLGVSSLSADMRRLLQLQGEHPHAGEAVELYCRQARKHIGAMAATLDGLDLLVFTGGVGEGAAEIRQRICQGLTHLGIALNPKANSNSGPVISAPGSRCEIRVIPTNEELMIARRTFQTLLQAD